MYNPANNNADNITFHINRINGNLAGRLTEVGTTAINNSSSVSNEEIVKRRVKRAYQEYFNTSYLHQERFSVNDKNKITRYLKAYFKLKKFKCSRETFW